VYGLIALTVSRQSREIGIRMAPGAGAVRVVFGVLGDSMRTTAIGVGTGLVATAALVAAMAAVLPTVEPWSAGAIPGAAVLLLAVASVAALVPATCSARRAEQCAARRRVTSLSGALPARYRRARQCEGSRPVTLCAALAQQHRSRRSAR
jgi:hypothetical protein